MAQQNISTVIFGCGNVVMGDDGYGPAVIDALNSQYQLPPGVEAIDAGTGIREYLFDYILTAEGRPDRIIVLDAVDFPDRQPGDVFLMDTSAIPPKKIHDFPSISFPPSTCWSNWNSIPVCASLSWLPRSKAFPKKSPRDSRRRCRLPFL